jgi:hypothetical protein
MRENIITNNARDFTSQKEFLLAGSIRKDKGQLLPKKGQVFKVIVDKFDVIEDYGTENEFEKELLEVQHILPSKME